MNVGNNPTTDRNKLGTKRHILTDKKGALSNNYEITGSLSKIMKL